ncbi:DUF952 domain-containing protein [Sneathiella limimaris]|uniref:DUF952 domain-containing protein n=1 Tax=Sneathiella limimaris TaxID=1964213 RepID=UPI001469A5B5|nr:DUF952 domain-containing protein [Sneathiella limimaris]
MTTIFHMADQDTWQEAVKSGSYAGTANDKADGFIHFSTAETVIESAAKHRAGVEGLLLIAVDADALGSDLKWEEARGGVLFPHLYADLKTELVSSVTPLPLGPDGLHIFPQLEGL